MAQEMVEGDPPYMEETAIKALFLIASKGRAPFKNPEKLSPAFKNFVKQCTIMDPNMRPTASTLLKHPFMATACSPAKLAHLVRKTQQMLVFESQNGYLPPIYDAPNLPPGGAEF